MFAIKSIDLASQEARRDSKPYGTRPERSESLVRSTGRGGGEFMLVYSSKDVLLRRSPKMASLEPRLTRFVCSA